MRIVEAAMNQYICEFEITPPVDATQMWGVWPFGLDGATQGASFDDAVAMAADWLLVTLQSAHEDGKVLPRQTFGHEPQQGGRVVAVAVVDNAQPNEVTLSDAAVIVSLSEEQMRHYWEVGTLYGRREGDQIYIERQSLNLLMDILEHTEQS